MDEFSKILITAGLTTFGAVLVFAATQLLGKLVIEPIQELKKVLGEIRYALVFHARAISTAVGDIPGEDEAAKVFRRLACELRSKIGAIPFFDTWSWLSRGFLPSRQDGIEASNLLIGISNSVHRSNRWELSGRRIEKLEKLLGFEPMGE